MADRGRRFSGAARGRLRHAALDAAERLGGRDGWSSLRMADVAAEVGISRQTLYAEFGSRPELLRQVVAARSGHLLDALSRLLARPDAIDPVRGAAAFLISSGRADPLVRHLVAGDGPDLGDSLRAGAASLVDVATRVLVAHVVGRRPEVDAAPLQIAAEAFARLVVSHVMAPDRDIDAAADAISAVLSPYLRTLLASAEPE
ncbi:TetR/AcrR family transcriptional regulator [Pseudonocardia sp. WMMC193]|uniref:TetR/AcrR family transcriptional regulator n=1 Tax=Pseudonocardia sp. WMMC193 TaxID=2911965 RepID=UPI001F02996B|nr:TetR family transcriptional regulator [Pseudonocardia sp. WMMC193]MCF7550765.1 TetR family transcriptional regulator [Pseudonocardia sp. WMMC193]